MAKISAPLKVEPVTQGTHLNLALISIAAHQICETSVGAPCEIIVEPVKQMPFSEYKTFQQYSQARAQMDNATQKPAVIPKKYQELIN